MNRTDHILSMIRYRFIQNGLRQGMSTGEANIMAEQVMKNNGLFGLFGLFNKMKVMGTPEGAISTIMEIFLTKWNKKLSENAVLAATTISDPSHEKIRVALFIEAIEEIETDRSKHWRGEIEYPRYIHDYMAYRIALEVRQTHKIDPSEMGLDEGTIKALSKLSYEYHAARIS